VAADSATRWGLPYSLPVIFNGTFAGRGSHITSHVARLSHNAGGAFANSIFLNELGGFTIEFKETASSSYTRFINGKPEVKNNIFRDVAENVPDGIFSIYAETGINTASQNQAFKACFSQALHCVSGPWLTITPGYYWLLPSGNNGDDPAPLPDNWLTEVNFKGAFGTVNQAKGWSLLYQSRLIGE
jgi:hypothetical protein